LKPTCMASRFSWSAKTTFHNLKRKYRGLVLLPSRFFPKLTETGEDFIQLG
jgi:hypothetical protein